MNRGLTLLETLAATVLLTALAVAVLPVMTTAQAQLGVSRLSPDLFPLSGVADTAISHPEIVGLDAEWAQRVLQLPVRFHTETTDDVEARIVSRGVGHAWVEFRSGDLRLVRWLPVAEEDQP